MLPNIPGLGKQIQQMQANMAKAQAEIEAAQLEASAGGGMVKVKISGEGDILDLQIAPEIVDPSDVEMLQDLILSALREATQKSKDFKTEKLGAAMPAGLAGNLPKGLF